MRRDPLNAIMHDARTCDWSGAWESGGGVRAGLGGGALARGRLEEVISRGLTRAGGVGCILLIGEMYNEDERLFEYHEGAGG